VAINSCKLFIGNFSAPLAFAYAMHKKTVVGISDNSDAIHQSGLNKVIPNIIQISDKNATTKKINQLCSSA
jgi:ADP-heptose:LPS heptosyltransferase